MRKKAAPKKATKTRPASKKKPAPRKVATKKTAKRKPAPKKVAKPPPPVAPAPTTPTRKVVPRKTYKLSRARVAKCDLVMLARANADIIMAAHDQAAGLVAMTKDEEAGAATLRQHVKLQIVIDDARRDRHEVQELRDLVAEMRELKDWIVKNGSSGGFVGTTQATH